MPSRYRALTWAFAEKCVERGLSPAQRVADAAFGARFGPALDLDDAVGSTMVG